MSNLGPYGVIHRRLWERRDFRALSFEAKALFCYLRTCPAGGLVAIFRFHADDAIEDLGMPAENVAPALSELERGSFIQREGRWLWVVDAFETTPGVTLKNIKHIAAVLRALRQVPDGLATEFARVYNVSESLPDSLSGSPSEATTVGKPEHVTVTAAVDEAERSFDQKEERTLSRTENRSTFDESSGNAALAEHRPPSDEPRWRCASYDEDFSDDELVAVRECSRESCGTTFAAVEGKNCPECNNPFTRLQHNLGCPTCGDEGECEAVPVSEARS